MDAARRASLIDEEAQQMRARELAVGVSSSKLKDVDRSTTEGIDIFVGTTDGGPTTKEASFGKPNPLAC